MTPRRTGRAGYDGRYDSEILGRFLGKDILVNPPPSALVPVTDVVRYDRLFGARVRCILTKLSSGVSQLGNDASSALLLLHSTFYGVVHTSMPVTVKVPCS